MNSCLNYATLPYVVETSYQCNPIRGPLKISFIFIYMISICLIDPVVHTIGATLSSIMVCIERYI